MLKTIKFLWALFVISVVFVLGILFFGWWSLIPFVLMVGVAAIYTYGKAPVKKEESKE